MDKMMTVCTRNNPNVLANGSSPPMTPALSAMKQRFGSGKRHGSAKAEVGGW